jgi:hypothetical protein
MSGSDAEDDRMERLRTSNSYQHGDDGLRDVSGHERDPDEDTVPEQSTGNAETNPVGIPPKAGYSSTDPRSDGA